jgi:hypothetical protein
MSEEWQIKRSKTVGSEDEDFYEDPNWKGSFEEHVLPEMKEQNR